MSFSNDMKKYGSAVANFLARYRNNDNNILSLKDESEGCVCFSPAPASL